MRVFNGCNIYGIVPNDKHCILFTGQNMKIIQFNDDSIIASKICHDWILDAQWINYKTFSTISMHNEFQIWDISLELKYETECEDKCILYSAHIYSENENIIVFSGTVFSEVLIWNAINKISNKCPVVKRLKGHKVCFKLLLSLSK